MYYLVMAHPPACCSAFGPFHLPPLPASPCCYGCLSLSSVFSHASAVSSLEPTCPRKKLIALPLLPLLHSLSTDKANRHNGVAALLGHPDTRHTVTCWECWCVTFFRFFFCKKWGRTRAKRWKVNLARNLA
jgi:hypothetical protein